MNWLLYTLLAAVFISLSNALTRFFQPVLSVPLGMFIFSVGVLFSSFCVSFFSGSFAWNSDMRVGVLFALMSGAVWGIGQLFFITALSKQAPLSVMVPIVVGGIGIGGIVAGTVIFKESITFFRIFAMMLVLIGSVLLARG